MIGNRQRANIQLRLIGAVSCALLLSSCSSHDDAAALPSPKASPQPSPLVQLDDHKIRQTYAALVALLNRVDSIPESSQKAELAKLSMEPQLSRVLVSVKRMRARKQASYGKAFAHIQSVELNGSEAVLHDCQDSSNTGLLNVTTKQKINRGVKEEHIKAYLAKKNGEWFISKMVSIGEGC